MTPREWKKAVAELAERYGWSVTLKPSGHYRLDKPGCQPVFTGSTGSDHRGIKNLESQLRKESVS